MLKKIVTLKGKSHALLKNKMQNFVYNKWNITCLSQVADDSDKSDRDPTTQELMNL